MNASLPRAALTVLVATLSLPAISIAAWTDPHASNVRDPKPCFGPGDVAFSRFSGPNAPDLELMRGCASIELNPAWAPLAWPKYDAFRRILLVSRELVSGYALYSIDCARNVEPFTIPEGVPGYYHTGVAPTGDGRIYLMSNVLFVIDANDMRHLVLAADGTPFQWPGVVSDLVYDGASNALILLSSTNGTAGPCTPIGQANAVVTKIPLNALGDQVAGPLASLTLCNGPHSTSVPRIARHVDGRLLLRIASSGSPDADVVWLDTATMSTHWFCTERLALGTAFLSTNGKSECAYSQAHGGVLDVTTNIPCGLGCTPMPILRVFAEGTSGFGVPLCAGQHDAPSQLVDLLPAR